MTRRRGKQRNQPEEMDPTGRFPSCESAAWWLIAGLERSVRELQARARAEKAAREKKKRRQALREQQEKQALGAGRELRRKAARMLQEVRARAKDGAART